MKNIRSKLNQSYKYNAQFLRLQHNSAILNQHQHQHQHQRQRQHQSITNSTASSPLNSPKFNSNHVKSSLPNNHNHLASKQLTNINVDQILLDISKCNDYNNLTKYISTINHQQHLNSQNSIFQLLTKWIKFNNKFNNKLPSFNALNGIFESLIRQHELITTTTTTTTTTTKNSSYVSNLLILYLYLYRFNHLALNILPLNLVWLQYGNPLIYNVYFLTYLKNLFNTNQNQLCIITLINELKITFQIDQDMEEIKILENLPRLMILYMIEMKNFDSLNFLISRFLIHKVIIDNELWNLLLQLGLENNNYQLVTLVYDNYIMKDFHQGKITLDDIILNTKLLSSHNSTVVDLKSFGDSLIFQILHTISMNGDIKRTEELITSHFIYKSLSNMDHGLTKELCIKIIESYCYNKPDNIKSLSSSSVSDNSVKEILSLIDVILDNQKNLSSIDFFECMNYKFKNWTITSSNENMSDSQQQRPPPPPPPLPPLHEEEEELPLLQGNKNLHNSKYGIILANLSNLHEFINIHMNYMDENNHKLETKTIFINCLLNHIMIFLNHSGVVSLLKNLHYLKGSSIITNNYLDSISWRLIIKSLSNSTSKKCGRIYYNYLKSRQKDIEITPLMYSQLIMTCINDDSNGYYHDVLFYIMEYFKDYSKLSDEIKEVLEYGGQFDINVQNLLDNIINWQNSNKNIETLLSNLKDIQLQPIENLIKRQYLEKYDLRDSEILMKIFQ